MIQWREVTRSFIVYGIIMAVLMFILTGCSSAETTKPAKEEPTAEEIEKEKEEQAEKEAAEAERERIAEERAIETAERQYNNHITEWNNELLEHVTAMSKVTTFVKENPQAIIDEDYKYIVEEVTARLNNLKAEVMLVVAPTKYQEFYGPYSQALTVYSESASLFRKAITEIDADALLESQEILATGDKYFSEAMDILTTIKLGDE